MIKILNIKQIKKAISNIRPNHIIKKTGLSRSTIYSLAKGIKKNYKITTILKITEYIKSINNKDFFTNK